MSARSYFSTSSTGLIEPIEELTRVSLLKSYETDEGLLPKGSRGTVVSVYEDGAAYCVEFSRPISALVTVSSVDIARLDDPRERSDASNEVPDRR